MFPPVRAQAPIHRLRPNETVRAPAAYLVIDTESVQEAGETETTHHLRLWAARLRRRRAGVHRAVLVADWWGHTALELAETVELATRGERSLWVYAHNLSFDLAVSRLPLELVRRGWTVTQLAVTGDSPWLRLSKGTRHLTLADSWGWLRRPLAEIGRAVGVEKPALPGEGDSEEAWLSRCQADVEILDTALSELMDWWERRRLGCWSLTGNSTGWNAMRHFRGGHRLVIDPDPELLRVDREAIYGGRRETWWISPQRHGAWADMDFRHAYPMVASRLPLPMRRGFTFASLPVDSDLIGGGNKGVLARVLVDTPVARWPVRWRHQVFYPVGRFWTTLADPEIEEARRLGCLIEVGAGQWHWLGLALQPWASWVIRVDEGSEDDSPPTARIAAHAWGRTVIGKLAQRTFTTWELSGSPTMDWGIEQGVVSGTGQMAAMVDLGGRRWHVRADLEGENSYPAILAWVESHVRLRLTRLLEVLEPSDLAQCDTDGLIVNGWAAPQLELAGRLTAPLEIRRKRSITRLGLWGPQHLEADGRRHFSGLAPGAVEERPGRFVVRGWPRLSWQMGHSEPGRYVQPDQTYHLQGPYTHRWVLADGSTLPVLAAQEAQEAFQPCPWSTDPRRLTHGPLGPAQHPLLRQLAAEPPG